MFRTAIYLGAANRISVPVRVRIYAIIAGEQVIYVGMDSRGVETLGGRSTYFQ